MMNWLRRWWSNSPSRIRTATNPQTRLNLELMEHRDVPSASPDNFISLPSFNGTSDSTVQLVSSVDGSQRIALIDVFPGYHGAIGSTTGDVNGDGISDVIVGAQAPNGHVKVFDGASGNLMQSFFAFPGFNGAVNVGSADVNGDHLADVLVTANATNGHVKAFSGNDGTLLSSFFAFPGFAGQTSVAGADFNNDGVAEIVVGAGAPGVGGRVALFNASGSVFNPGFFAFPGYDGGINVDAGDVNGDGVTDIVTSAGAGVPGGHVEAFSGNNFAPIDSFVPYVSSVTDGADFRLADSNLDGRTDILTFVSGKGNLGVAAYDGLTQTTVLRGGGGDGTYSSPDPSYDNGNFDNDYNNTFTDFSYTPTDPGYTPPDSGYTPPDSSSYDSGSYDSGDDSGSYDYDPDSDSSYDPGYDYGSWE